MSWLQGNPCFMPTKVSTPKKSPGNAKIPVFYFSSSPFTDVFVWDPLGSSICLFFQPHISLLFNTQLLLIALSLPTTCGFSIVFLFSFRQVCVETLSVDCHMDSCSSFKIWLRLWPFLALLLSFPFVQYFIHSFKYLFHYDSVRYSLKRGRCSSEQNKSLPSWSLHARVGQNRQ